MENTDLSIYIYIYIYNIHIHIYIYIYNISEIETDKFLSYTVLHGFMRFHNRPSITSDDCGITV